MCLCLLGLLRKQHAYFPEKNFKPSKLLGSLFLPFNCCFVFGATGLSDAYTKFEAQMFRCSFNLENNSRASLRKTIRKIKTKILKPLGLNSSMAKRHTAIP